MWVLLLAMILVYALMIRSREHLTLLTEYPFVTFESQQNPPDSGGGVEVYSLTPNTCPPEFPERVALNCHKRCRTGFTGHVTMCVADSHNRGVGIPIELEPCPDGWHTEGLICREPIRNDCSLRGLFRECWGRLTGGRLKGRLDGGGVCGNKDGPTRDHPDKVDGLCYRRCPADKPQRIPGMPYLCYAGGPLTYDRGTGITTPAAAILNRRFTFGI